MLKHERVNGRDVYMSERGTLEVWKPSPAVVSLKLDGKLDLELAAQILHTYDEVVSAERQLDIFADWEKMTAYASQTRSTMTIWCEANRAKIKSLSVLLGSEIGRLRIGIVNEMLGGMIRTYTDREDYEAAMARAAAGYGKPLVPTSSLQPSAFQAASA